jgi:hypothetical protein
MVDTDPPLASLRLRYDVRAHLEAIGIRKLSELAHLSLAEVENIQGLGVQTVKRLRLSLQALGMDFDHHPDVTGTALRRAERISGQPQLHRRLHDFSKVSDLDLDAASLKKILAIRIGSVGALRRLTPAVLSAALGKSTARALLTALNKAHLPLIPIASTMDLWHAGLIETSELQRPLDTDSIRNWEPWIGVHAHALADAGIANLVQLKQTTKHTRLDRLQGIGEYAARKIIKTLHLDDSTCRCKKVHEKQEKEAA